MTLDKKLGPATRDAYGKILVELGKTNKDIVVLDGDLSKSTKTEGFSKAFPERFFNCGIQEANMVGIAAGLASSGKIPFVSSFACFLICKGYDQLRMGIAFPELNAKFIASHGGISVGEDGASQQSIEDFALTTSLPNFRVVVPCDALEAEELVKEAARIKGPVYMRTGRPKAPVIYDKPRSFQIGKGIVLREGKDVTLVACGLLVWEALSAAETLSRENIQARVIDMHTLKPLDESLLLESAKVTGAVVTAEEHSIWGGLHSTVSSYLTRHLAVPTEAVAIQDTYAESGKPDELMKKYGLTDQCIVEAARRVAARKKKG